MLAGHGQQISRTAEVGDHADHAADVGNPGLVDDGEDVEDGEQDEGADRLQAGGQAVQRRRVVERREHVGHDDQPDHHPDQRLLVLAVGPADKTASDAARSEHLVPVQFRRLIHPQVLFPGSFAWRRASLT